MWELDTLTTVCVKAIFAKFCLCEHDMSCALEKTVMLELSEYLKSCSSTTKKIISLLPQWVWACSTCHGIKLVLFHVCLIWNSLSLCLKQRQSLAEFRIKIKIIKYWFCLCHMKRVVSISVEHTKWLGRLNRYYTTTNAKKEDALLRLDVHWVSLYNI